MLQRTFIIALAGLSIVLNACGAQSVVGTGLPGPASNRAASQSRQVGASLFWKPAFLSMTHGHVKTTRLLYAPASLEFEITKRCDTSIVSVTQTGSGHLRRHEYSEYSVQALTNTSYTCSVYATAPHAQIRATLQITVRRGR